MRASVYFGGSRHLTHTPTIKAVVQAVINSGCAVHVGCQWGADAQIIRAGMFSPSFLVVFAVATPAALPPHVAAAASAGAQVIAQAGGTNTPMKARYLLRSKAALNGCVQAVFFHPGPGSLAVARECVQKMPVFAFAPEAPRPIPSAAGCWQPVESVSYYAAFGAVCWRWQSSQHGIL